MLPLQEPLERILKLRLVSESDGGMKIRPDLLAV